MADIENNGGNWIKLNRSIRENFIWNFEKPQYALAWIDLLLLANYKDKKILFDGKVETVKRGTFITSMVKLAKRWSMDRGTVKRFLELLQNEGMITYQCNNKRTVINIVNYRVFQDFGGTNAAAETTADAAPETAAETTADAAQHKKVKKVKEREESKNILSTSKEVDCSTDVQHTIIQAWNGLGLSKVLKIVPDSTRDKLLSKRIKDYGVDHVLAAIEKVRQSQFLNGNNNKGWVITFDWFIKPDNFAKVVGGNYDNNQAPPQTKTGGRKEMVPGWMDKGRDPDAQMAKDLKWLEQFSAAQKTVENDADLKARADALRRKIAGEEPNNGNGKES